MEILKNYISIDNIIMWKLSNSNFGSVNDPYIKHWDQKTLIYLLNWYCILHDIRYHNGFLYIKIEESQSSYIQYHATKWLKNNVGRIYASFF